MWWIVGGIAAVALIAFLLWLFSPERFLGSSGDGDCDGCKSGRSVDNTASKMTAVKEILGGDPLVAQQMLKQAGLSHVSLKDVSESRELVEQIARRIPDISLESLLVAVNQKEIDFELQKCAVRNLVLFPTSDIEPVQMSDITEMSSILPEQLMLSDDQFYHQLATGGLMTMQSFESRSDQKILYILVDVSGSMNDVEFRGQPRNVWARGVTVNLLVKAVRGEAKYFLRFFDSEPHDLQKAMNPIEAERLIEYVMNRGYSGGGTNIASAFKRAIKDIRELGGEFEQAEVLIITDAEDNSMDDTQGVKKLMGDDIRLHVIVLGSEAEALKKVATSYRSL